MMMINIVLFNNTSDKRCLTKNLTELVNVNASVIEECDLDNPVFKLKFTEPMLRCNYVYAFGYYYFCTLEFQIGGMCYLRCHKDALMSNRDALLNLNCEISRQEHSGLTLVPDSQIMIQNYDVINVYRFNNYFDTQLGQYVMQVIGGK